jgi:outer membrane usher protein
VRAIRKWLVACGLLASLGTLVPVAAQSATPGISQPIGDRRAPLGLVVDGVTKAQTVVVILRGNDVLVLESDLQAAAVPLPGATFVALEGNRYVSLDSLAPKIRFKVDEAALALDIQIDPALLEHAAIAVGDSELKIRPARADPSGFLTYSVSSNADNLSGRTNAYLQAGAGSATAGLFTASASYSDGIAHRGLIAYQRESEINLSRLTVGDEYATTGDLGANVVVGGLGSSRHFEFQPEYAYYPTPGLRGEVLSPTTADLYVNGTFLRSVQLAPGTFDLSEIPVPPGAGVTKIVLRDAYGNSQTLGGTYYETRHLLRKGVTDYDYHVGFLRKDPFGANDVYGPLAALGEYRIGLTDGLTVGGRFERTAGSTSGGPQLDAALPIGHVSLEADASDAFGLGGNAFGAAYDYYSRRIGITISAETQSPAYSNASLEAGAQRQRSSVRESLGLPLSTFSTITVSNTTTSFTDEPVSGELVADATIRPPHRNMFLDLRVERDSGGEIFGITPVLGAGTPILAVARPLSTARTTFGIQATFITGRTTQLTAGTNNAAGSGSATLSLEKSAPTGPGFGYQVQGTTGAGRFASSEVSYQTQYGDIQALSNSGIGPSSTSLTLTGSLVAFPQGAFFTRPVEGAYALVEVPGYAHLPVFFNDQYAGRTDRRDAAVVPDLSPYYDNRVGIDDLRDHLDLAEDFSVAEVRPKNSSGADTEFTIRHFHAYSGHIVIHRDGRTIVPVLGQVVLTRAGKSFPSDLGREGQFYIENLEAGTFSAAVTTSDELTCAFTAVLAPDARPVTDMGTFVCEAAK